MTDPQRFALEAVIAGADSFAAVGEMIDRSTSSAFALCLRLRAAGLVTWEDNRDGTLRPLVVKIRGDLYRAVSVTR